MHKTRVMSVTCLLSLRRSLQDAYPSGEPDFSDHSTPVLLGLPNTNNNGYALIFLYISVSILKFKLIQSIYCGCIVLILNYN